MTRAKRDAEKYPMCEKLSSVREESQKIGEFLDWLSEREPRIVLCVSEWHCGRQLNDYYPAGISINKLLMEYFEIDENKLEAERRSILDGLFQVGGTSVD